MRVFIAGASGAIGTPLVSQLIQRSHEVIGTCRSPANAERLRALGATPVLLDLLDPHSVRQAVLDARPDAIVHQATALGGARFGRSLDRTFAATNRLRTEGTDALLAAADAAGDGAGIYNIVDDEPAPARDWLPALAGALGAKPPRHLPSGLARLVAGPAAVITATQARGASNAKAKGELGWTLRYPSWRDGFPATYTRVRDSISARAPGRELERQLRPIRARGNLRDWW